MTLPKCQCTAE